jgi:hypothetical protein
VAAGDSLAFSTERNFCIRKTNRNSRGFDRYFPHKEGSEEFDVHAA